MIKGIGRKLAANLILISSIQNCSRGSSQLSEQRKRDKIYQDRKGRNKAVFIHECAANLTVYMKKLLELVDEFSKAYGSHINIKRSVLISAN